MVVGGNYTVDFNGQRGLFEIRSTNDKPIPETLKGAWTHRSMAEKALSEYVVESAANGKRTTK